MRLADITSSNASILQFLRDKNVLSKASFCNNCNVFKRQVVMNSYPDGYCWRFPTCHQRESVRKYSFFGQKQKQSLKMYLYLLYFFVNKIEANTVEKMLEGIKRETIYDWCNFYRDIMSQELLANPIILGGPNEIVEIDENKWGGKRKYHRGRVNHENTKPWIFGMICRT